MSKGTSEEKSRESVGSSLQIRTTRQVLFAIRLRDWLQEQPFDCALQPGKHQASYYRCRSKREAEGGVQRTSLAHIQIKSKALGGVSISRFYLETHLQILYFPLWRLFELFYIMFQDVPPVASYPLSLVFSQDALLCDQQPQVVFWSSICSLFLLWTKPKPEPLLLPSTRYSQMLSSVGWRCWLLRDVRQKVQQTHIRDNNTHFKIRNKFYMLSVEFFHVIKFHYWILRISKSRPLH